MDVISNAQYDVRSQYGHLILLCLAKDEEKTQALRLELSKAGYAYLYFPISADTLAQHDYLSEVTKALDACSCMIPVITTDLFSEEAVIYRNVFWFVIGYMQTKCHESIVPYIAEGDDSRLATTPLKNASPSFTTAEIVSTLETKYAGALMKSQYYDNYLLNYYAYNRIIYRRLVLKLRIYEDAFRHICEAMEYEWGRNAESRLDRFLEKNLFCAYKVLSFGCDNGLEPQFEPYREEIHPSENGLASSIICKSKYNVLEDEDRHASGVHAEVDVEIVIPVHKLFGVYFKCYMGLKQKDYFWMLPTLLSRDIGKYDFSEPPDDDMMENPTYWNNLFPKSTYTDFGKGRLYFSLGLERHNTEKSIVLTPEMGVGMTADYIFPQ
ncbi:MAG: hypothetical protein J6T24_01295 [Clostridia bacterium]|nr:hypothetical protein [Clostridia bacterium]